MARTANAGDPAVYAEAGSDIVLVCHEYPHETDVYLGLLDAVKDGTIPMERVNESVRRIVKAKLLHAQS